MVKKLFVVLILIFASSSLWAQPKPGQPPRPGQPANAQQAPETPEVEPKERISKIRTFLQPFEYDRDRIRDPFETQTNNAPLKPGQVYGPFLEVQNIRLSDYKLKGLLWQTKNPVAVFETPEGRQYRLTIKDYIGENFGYIATIREREVVVIQTIEENDRRYSTTKVVFLNR